MLLKAISRATSVGSARLKFCSHKQRRPTQALRPLLGPRLSVEIKDRLVLHRGHSLTWSLQSPSLLLSLLQCRNKLESPAT